MNPIVLMVNERGGNRTDGFVCRYVCMEGGFGGEVVVGVKGEVPDRDGPCLDGC